MYGCKGAANLSGKRTELFKQCVRYSLGADVLSALFLRVFTAFGGLEMKIRFMRKRSHM